MNENGWNTQHGIHWYEMPKKPYHIKLDEDVDPVICPPRKVSVSLHTKTWDQIKRDGQSNHCKESEPAINMVHSLAIVENWI